MDLTCAACGAPLDGDSRFWCRAHYRVIGSIRITQETIDQMQADATKRFRDSVNEWIEKIKTGGIHGTGPVTGEAGEG